ncbi:MAG: hypothetical protein JWP10_1169 [Nocardioidaceae bacterium]|nr:hypothetical protein [Nocardioidaceae bacterium]
MPTTDEGLQERVERLERALQEVHDDREIRDLIAKYGHLADGGEDADFVDLWANDAVMDLSMGVTALGGWVEPQRWEGKEAIAAFIGDPDTAKKEGVFRRTVHLMDNNLIIKVDGDEAVAVANTFVLLQTEATVLVIGGGANRWFLRRESGRWVFVERRRREVGNPDFGPTLLDKLEVTR